ncbi:MAG: threonine aldolase family protein [Alphaproteobacteria bacterium]
MTALAVDLYSDTITRPTNAMRQAMANAEVGNEQAGEDPTVNKLIEMVAELTGHESAVFLPSGTMCNAIAYRVYCRQGDSVIMDQLAHPIHAEAGGPAALSGCMITQLDGGRRGVFSGASVDQAMKPYKHNRPVPKLVSIEQTSNFGGGACWTLDEVKDVAEASKRHGLAMHMDGARLLNAVEATGTSAQKFASNCDSAWIDLSKGLGCPVGAVLVGSRDFIEESWRWKHQFGGAMRQSGIIAAAGVYALQNHVERLADDHINAKRLAQGLMQIPGIEVDPEEPETNMVFFDATATGIDNYEMSEKLLQKGIRIGAGYGPKDLMRAVTHLDVDASGIDLALSVIRDVVAGRD